jgi:hypothetical protein
MTSRMVPTHTVASDLERAEALIRRADASMEEAERRSGRATGGGRRGQLFGRKG